MPRKSKEAATPPDAITGQLAALCDKLVVSGGQICAGIESYEKECAELKEVLEKEIEQCKSMEEVQTLTSAALKTLEALNEAGLPSTLPRPSKVIEKAKAGRIDNILVIAKNSISSGQFLDQLNKNDENKLLELLLKRRNEGEKTSVEKTSTSSSNSGKNDTAKSKPTTPRSAGKRGMKRASLPEKKEKATPAAKKSRLSVPSAAPNSPSPITNTANARMLKENPSFRKFVAFELAALYLQSKVNDGSISANLPEFEHFEVPETFPGRFATGMEGLSFILGHFACSVADQCMLGYKTSTADFQSHFPHYSKSCTLAANRFSACDENLYRASYAFRDIVKLACKCTKQVEDKFFKSMDTFLIPTPILSTKKSTKLRVSQSIIDALSSKRTLQDVVSFVKRGLQISGNGEETDFEAEAQKPGAVADEVEDVATVVAEKSSVNGNVVVTEEEDGTASEASGFESD